MSTLLLIPEKQIRYNVEACQRQGNGFDCRVFAIAFAASLVHGEDTSESSYAPSKMSAIYENESTPIVLLHFHQQEVSPRGKVERILLNRIYIEFVERLSTWWGKTPW